jgi:hypothetical protein
MTPATEKLDSTPAMRERARQIRESLKHKPGLDELFTPQELADATPHYFALRRCIGQLVLARKDVGLSIAEVATKTGFTEDEVTCLENGSMTNPPFKLLATYAVAVGRKLTLSVE